MAKSSGIGQLLAVGGYNLTTDIQTVNVRGGPNLLPATSIDKSAEARMAGILDGGLDIGAFFDDATDLAHARFKGLTTSDVHVAYLMSSTLGAEGVFLVAKQVDYAGTRGADGSLLFSVPHVSSGYSVEWCDLLTAGLRTDTTGTNGTGVDGAAASSTGWAAYLQVIALTGTNVVVTLEDSADNVSFAVFTSSAFTSATAARTVQRIEGAVGATVRRYVRAVSSGTFTSATFLVGFTRRPTGS